MSYGQRAKLALAVLVLSHGNFLILDEPTSHMDMAALGAVEDALSTFTRPMLVVSHDRDFIDKLASQIWDVRDAGLKRYEGGWTVFLRAREEGRALPDPVVVLGGDAARAGTPGSDARAQASGAAFRPPRAVVPKREPPPTSRNTAPDAENGSRGRNGRRTASAVRRVDPLRALEARIASMELQLTQMSKKLADIALQGNYLETRRLGAEHAELETALAALYSEWTAAGQEQGQPKA
ncbi:MAG: hypothetical protein NVS1B1_15120 [Candidatus Limnocylindrales bacterium]